MEYRDKVTRQQAMETWLKRDQKGGHDLQNHSLLNPQDSRPTVSGYFVTNFLRRIQFNTLYRYQSKFFAMPELAERPGGIVDQVLPYQQQDW